jgi:hypothetical protein
MKARFVTRLPEPRFYTCKMRRCGMFQYGLGLDLRCGFGHGQQCGQSASSLRLLERPLWGESKFKQQSARWVAPGTSFSIHLETT